MSDKIGTKGNMRELIPNYNCTVRSIWNNTVEGARWGNYRAMVSSLALNALQDRKNPIGGTEGQGTYFATRLKCTNADDRRGSTRREWNSTGTVKFERGRAH